MANERTRPIQIDPTRKYWAVRLIEVVGEVNIECIIHDIPADNKADAGMKGLMKYLRSHPGSEPKLKQVELEHYSKPIQIWN